MKAPGTGSRARSREIGYAEGLAEVGWLLREEAQRWRNEAEHQLAPEWRAALRACADNVARIGDYAFSARELYGEYQGGRLAWEAGWQDMAEAEGWRPAGPRERPGAAERRER